MHRPRLRSLLLCDPVRSFSRDLPRQSQYHVRCPGIQGLFKNESPRPSTEAGQLQTCRRTPDSGATGGAPLGEHLRGQRPSLGLAQKEAAAQIDVSQDTISRWDLGRRRPSPKEWGRIRNLFRSELSQG
jgi:DNA-binding XRE family transcriptional regulator